MYGCVCEGALPPHANQSANRLSYVKTMECAEGLSVFLSAGLSLVVIFTIVVVVDVVCCLLLLLSVSRVQMINNFW
jgi:hypothetical protein